MSIASWGSLKVGHSVRVDMIYIGTLLDVDPEREYISVYTHKARKIRTETVCKGCMLVELLPQVPGGRKKKVWVAISRVTKY